MNNDLYEDEVGFSQEEKYVMSKFSHPVPKISWYLEMSRLSAVILHM